MTRLSCEVGWGLSSVRFGRQWLFWQTRPCQRLDDIRRVFFRGFGRIFPHIARRIFLVSSWWLVVFVGVVCCWARAVVRFVQRARCGRYCRCHTVSIRTQHVSIHDSYLLVMHTPLNCCRRASSNIPTFVLNVLSKRNLCLCACPTSRRARPRPKGPQVTFNFHTSTRTYDCIIKLKIHSSCEIEDFVETHLCKLCVILR